MCGYLRPELNFTSLEALMAAIHSDIALAKGNLDAEPARSALASHAAFLQP